ncbi:unnamed protein product [Phaeothamnion confervicola]
MLSEVKITRPNQGLPAAVSNVPAAALPRDPEQQLERLELKPQDVTHVLYHADCPDGMGAAFAAWKSLGNKAEYIAVKHEVAPPQLPRNANVAIVDFSFPRETLLELKSKVENMVLLDHHKSAQDQLQDLDFVAFDLNRAAAGIAWKYFHPTKQQPELLHYVEDSDLGRHQLPHTREINAALSTYPLDFNVWEKLSVDQLKEEGPGVLAARDRRAGDVAKGAKWQDVGGYHVPTVNVTPDYAAEVREKLFENHPEAPFVAIYSVDHEHVERWSLYSQGDFDVSKLAENKGGGGHPYAAGFRIFPNQF